MSPKMSNLGMKLRELMPDYFAQKGPFEGTVYKIGKLGDSIVRAPNGDDVVIDDYNGLERPNIGDKVKAEVIRDGKGKSYSFGKLLEVCPNPQNEVYHPTTQSKLESLIKKLKIYVRRGKI